MQFHRTTTDIYISDNLILSREYGFTPNGNLLSGKWVLRDKGTGQMIDFDTYRNDLCERNGFIIKEEITK